MKLSVPVFKLKRQAKTLSREKNIPLHSALDQIATKHGFIQWSHLSSVETNQIPSRKILARLNAGDLMLLAARPGHGKTVLAFQLLLDAIKSGKQGFFFSLDYTALDIWSQIKKLGENPDAYSNTLHVDTSDDICADYIIKQLNQINGKAFIVIDYMQLLDQKRNNPSLDIQVRQLAEFAKANGSIIVVLSQIHRSYELSSKSIPEIVDVKLPNPANLEQFSKTCFLHDGQIEFSNTA